MISPVLTAHPGQAGEEFNEERLEVEDYAGMSAVCEAGNHTSVFEDDETSGGAWVQIAHEGCELTYDDIYVPLCGEFRTGSMHTWTDFGFADALLEVRVDGVLVATFQGDTTAEDFTVHSLTPTAVVRSGHHTIKLLYDEVGNGQEVWLWIDYLELVEVNDAGCQGPATGTCRNGPFPALPEILGADGFGDGSLGWVDRPYRFRAASFVDPEGDPVRFEWVWGDGTTTNGTTSWQDHAFDDHDSYDVVLRAWDDPTGRCPAVGPRRVESDPWRFEVVDPWKVRMERLQPVGSDHGASCIHNVPLNTFGTNFIVGSCETVARLTGTGTEYASQMVMTFDGHAWSVDWDSPYEFPYDSTNMPAGSHELQACASAVNDRHHVANCSSPYRFTNVNPLDLPVDG